MPWAPCGAVGTRGSPTCSPPFTGVRSSSPRSSALGLSPSRRSRPARTPTRSSSRRRLRSVQRARGWRPIPKSRRRASSSATKRRSRATATRSAPRLRHGRQPHDRPPRRGEDRRVAARRAAQLRLAHAGRDRRDRPPRGAHPRRRRASRRPHDALERRGCRRRRPRRDRRQAPGLRHAARRGRRPADAGADRPLRRRRDPDGADRGAHSARRTRRPRDAERAVARARGDGRSLRGGPRRRRAPRSCRGRALSPGQRRTRARARHGCRHSRLRVRPGVLRPARRGDDRGRDPPRAVTRGLDPARRADDARHGAPPARREDAPGGAARGRHLARRDDDPRDPGAGKRGRSRGALQRDSSGNGKVQGTGGRRAVSDVELVVLDDADAVADAVARRLATAAAEGGNVVLTGGTTPKQAYERAASLAADWSRVEVWWGDERCVPPDDENSNFGMAKRALLDHLERAPLAVHRIEGELGKDAAAAEYEDELGSTALDLLLLGIGPDGHVASLFPGKPALEETERRVVGTEPGLEPWVDRVTLTLPALRAAGEILFVVAGESKADAVRRAFASEPNPETPASLVRADSGRTTAILDRPAAAAIEA